MNIPPNLQQAYRNLMLQMGPTFPDKVWCELCDHIHTDTWFKVGAVVDHLPCFKNYSRATARQYLTAVLKCVLANYQHEPNEAKAPVEYARRSWKI